MKTVPKEKTEERIDEKQMDIAIWRYGIISQLLHIQIDGPNFGEILEELSAKNWNHPLGHVVKLSEETIRKWLYRYRRGGLPSIASRERSDKGSTRIPDRITERFFELRKEHPRWTVAGILKHMIEDKTWNGRNPARSVLYRFASTHNLSRDPHLDSKQVVMPFAFEHFGQLWVADFYHGPRIHDGLNRRKTYLHAILDDSSRFVVSAGFYLAESVETLITEMNIAITRFGIPQRFYTDNGACYSSRHLKIVCARTGIQLVHTPPYRPQGRGKVERFFRTVKEQFLETGKARTLDDLNSSFQKWLAEYHQKIHSSLGCTPLQKRLTSQNLCKRLPEVTDTDAMFRQEKRCRIYRDGTIRIHGRLFEVPGETPGKRVTAYFLPWDLSTVHYGDEMAMARPVDMIRNARRFEHPAKRISKEEK